MLPFAARGSRRSGRMSRTSRWCPLGSHRERLKVLSGISAFTSLKPLPNPEFKLG